MSEAREIAESLNPGYVVWLQLTGYANSVAAARQFVKTDRLLCDETFTIIDNIACSLYATVG